MKNGGRNFKLPIIIGLLIIGIGSCSVAVTMTGNSGFDGIVPSLIGWLCITFAIIFFVIDKVTQVILEKKSNGDLDSLEQFDRITTEKHLDQALYFSLASFVLHCAFKYFLLGAGHSYSVFSIITYVGLISCSYIGFLKGHQFFIIVWLITLLYLLLSSIYLISLILLDYRIGLILIIIPVIYYYCMRILFRIRKSI